MAWWNFFEVTINLSLEIIILPETFHFSNAYYYNSMPGNSIRNGFLLLNPCAGYIITGITFGDSDLWED